MNLIQHSYVTTITTYLEWFTSVFECPAEQQIIKDRWWTTEVSGHKNFSHILAYFCEYLAIRVTVASLHNYNLFIKLRAVGHGVRAFYWKVSSSQNFWHPFVFSLTFSPRSSCFHGSQERKRRGTFYGCSNLRAPTSHIPTIRQQWEQKSERKEKKNQGFELHSG